MRLLPYYCRLLGWSGCLGIAFSVGVVVIGGIMASDEEPLILPLVMVPCVIMVGWFLWRLRPAAESLRIATVGTPARATVVEVGETGVSVMNAWLVRFVLDVHPGAAADYRVAFRELVPKLAVGHFRPGADIPVMVDPDDPHRVTVQTPASCD